jgi:hypothetical protein
MNADRLKELAGQQVEAERRMAANKGTGEKAMAEAWERCLDALLINRERVAGVAIVLVSKPGTVFINPAEQDIGGGQGLGRFISLSGAESPEAEVMLVVLAERMQETITQAQGL